MRRGCRTWSADRLDDCRGSFRNDTSATRLCSAVLIEQDDESLVYVRCLSEESMSLLSADLVLIGTPSHDQDEVMPTNAT